MNTVQNLLTVVASGIEFFALGYGLLAFALFAYRRQELEKRAIAPQKQAVPALPQAVTVPYTAPVRETTPEKVAVAAR